MFKAHVAARAEREMSEDDAKFLEACERKMKEGTSIVNYDEAIVTMPARVLRRLLALASAQRKTESEGT